LLREKRIGMAKIKCEVVTVERIVFSDEVDMVIAPGAEWTLGILPHHAPLMTTLTVGELRIKKEGEEDLSLAIGGGFMEVRSDKVTILADAAERAEEIDEERAEAARQRAEERLKRHKAGEVVDLEQAAAALRRSQIRLKVARKRRRRRNGRGSRVDGEPIS
jgi:F-type H+-transporting ATPase subunit epsilon